VQGVAFRAATLQQAQHIGIDGWVRNLADGSVEAVLEGGAEDVARLEAWCGHGPEWAEVLEIEARDEPSEGLRGFAIR
jgi:acylphosphatase